MFAFFDKNKVFFDFSDAKTKLQIDQGHVRISGHCHNVGRQFNLSPLCVQ